MKITFFGLTISSSWGNGHATPYRALLKALHRRGVRLTFYEKDVPYYAQHRDFTSCDYCDLVLYRDWSDISRGALREAQDSDIIITASYCPEGARISDETLDVDGPLHVFYDLDTPITLKNLANGPLQYLRQDQISDFDLYLSFTGGKILQMLTQEYGARLARPLYGCVDPDAYRRVPRYESYECGLSYMGTYAADRQQKLQELFFAPATELGYMEFVLAGSLYPNADQEHWPRNVRYFEHLSPQQHPALYSSSRATLNITRQEMAASGYCPSGRFFEASACGTPVLTDEWEGLETFFDLKSELIAVRNAADVISALELPEEELRERGRRARARTLEEHTGQRRAEQLLAYCEEASQKRGSTVEVMG